MDFPTIVATVTAVAWVARNQERLIMIPRRQALVTLRDGLRAARLFLYRSVYLRYRSEISQVAGFLLLYRSAFECDCCCLRLGGQDLDVGYKEACQCDNAGGDSKYCYTCICTYVETQATEGQATKLVCMATRQCQLDDRLVRRRLSPTAVLLLDRNQIIQAAAAAEASATKKGIREEKLWHCPSPDCAYIGFISSKTGRLPERPTMFQSLTRIFHVKTKPDPRSIRCPVCLISSCQFCARVWTKGSADHTGRTCEKYAAQQLATDDDSAALAHWKARARVQSCRLCHSVIEKNDGCKHMTCRCGFQFCWVCGEEWTDQHSVFFCRPMASTPEGGGGGGFAAWLGSWFFA